MIEIIKINESYIRVFCEYDVSIMLYEYFSFFTKNYKWSPKYKSGVWDGKIRLFNMKNGLLPIGLYNDLLFFLKKNDLDFKDKTVFYSGLNFSVEFINKFIEEVLKCDLSQRDYQIKSVQHILKNKKTIILSATGSGKSFIIFSYINLLKYVDNNFKFLIVVPTTSLVEQMTTDFVEYGRNFCDYNDHIHKIYSGVSKETNKCIVISTWQSLQNIKNRQWFQKFSCVTIDETHGATAAQLSKIVLKCENAIYKIGTTGSLSDNETDKMQLKALFSNIYLASNTKNLQKRKILSKLRIRNCILEYPFKYRNLCKKFDYQTEIDFIRSLNQRKKFICQLVNKIKDNTLVLFRSIEYGKKLFELSKERRENVYFIYGGTKTIDREIIRKLAEVDNDIIIIASYGVFSTGINIRNLHNLVFAESMKSSIKVIQSIGRTLRLHKNKKIATLYDICDDLQYLKHKNYLLKHFLERIKIYDREGFNYKTKSFKIKEEHEIMD